MDQFDPRPRILGHEWCHCGALVPVGEYRSCGHQCFECFDGSPYTRQAKAIVVAVDGARNTLRPPKTVRQRRSPDKAAIKQRANDAKEDDKALRRADFAALKRLADAYPAMYLVFRNEERRKIGQPLVMPHDGARFDEAVRTFLAESPYYPLLEDLREGHRWESGPGTSGSMPTESSLPPPES